MDCRCEHCKALEPEWNTVADYLKFSESAYKLGKMDVTANAEISAKYTIQRLPEVIYFNYGVPKTYLGARNSSSIIDWINEISAPITELKSISDLDSFKNKHDIFVLGLFTSLLSDSARRFIAAANKDSFTTYAISKNNEIKKQLNITLDTVTVLKSFDEGRADLLVPLSFEVQLTRFLSVNSKPLIQEYEPSLAKQMLKTAIKKYVFLFTDKINVYYKRDIKILENVAKKFKGKVIFVNIPSTEKTFMKFFSIQDSNIPAILVSDMSGNDENMKNFRYSGETINENDVTEFIKKYLFAKKLKANVVQTSEKVLSSDTEGFLIFFYFIFFFLL
jgi:hypothetical protein